MVAGDNPSPAKAATNRHNINSFTGNGLVMLCL